MCRCRRISSGPTRPRIASGIKPCLRARPDRWPRQRRACISRPKSWMQCRKAGAEIAYVTLHVGLGTFQPVRGEKLHAERFFINSQNEATIRAAERVICAGTTSVRAVESIYLGKSVETDLFIRPGFEFRRTNAMLTNFHLPESSLLMLVCAFAGREFVLSAYEHAVKEGYRFYSYGDCMLIRLSQKPKNDCQDFRPSVLCDLRASKPSCGAYGSVSR